MLCIRVVINVAQFWALAIVKMLVGRFHRTRPADDGAWNTRTRKDSRATNEADESANRSGNLKKHIENNPLMFHRSGEV